ncbi:hypothetical protein INT48_003700 [Thamnidium elegans]|uniref:Uncharacterized protein n=1 Tax=Thamnidium elegans TaxID=101142 RepID=A0A8H7SH47_9FUNG|nr:hypothetical protein INT48_003700 [Thamnidium elegans]
MPPKRKQMEGNKLEDVMDAIKTTVEDTIKDSISKELAPLLTRLDDIDGNISELSEKIDNFNLMNHNSVIIDETNIIPVPESDGRSKEVQIMDMFKEEFIESTEEERKPMLGVLQRAAKSACQSFGQDQEKGNLPWKNLSGEDRLSLLKVTLDEAKVGERRLHLLSRCTRSWACEYIVE